MIKRTIDIVPEIVIAIRVLNDIEETEQMTHAQRNKVNFVRSVLLAKLVNVFSDYAGNNADLLLHRFVEKKYDNDDLPF